MKRNITEKEGEKIIIEYTKQVMHNRIAHHLLTDV